MLIMSLIHFSYLEHAYVTTNAAAWANHIEWNIIATEYVLFMFVDISD